MNTISLSILGMVYLLFRVHYRSTVLSCFFLIVRFLASIRLRHRYEKDWFCGFLLSSSHNLAKQLMANFDSQVIFKKVKGKVVKSDSDMSGKAVWDFIFTEDQIYPSCPFPPFLNMGLEAVTLEFQRQARITIISGLFLIIVLIQMNLFHDAKNYWEHIFMSINVIIYEHQKVRGSQGTLWSPFWCLFSVWLHTTSAG